MAPHRFAVRALLSLAIALPLTGTGGCASEPQEPMGKLTIGIVSYDTGARSVEQYQPFKDYLAQQTRMVVELEPAFNELQAVEQIQRRQVWSLVFAPPGLAAIAIGQEQYVPIFPLQGPNNVRSVLVVPDDSPAQTLGDLAGQAIALGEPGSASGYYLPLYVLYGLTLSEVKFAPTPRTILEWVSDGSVAAGAISEQDYQAFRNEFAPVQFRVLHTSRPMPQGVVLVGPTVDRNQQQLIEEAMRQAPSNIISDAGYVPNATLPSYDQFIQLIEKVRPLEEQVKETPAVLTID